MYLKTLTLLLTLLISASGLCNDYYRALDLFNRKKINQSIELFKSVANNHKNEDRSKAYFNLAVIYDYGYGVGIDKTKALYFYKKSSKLNNEFAMYNLGWMYQTGENVNKDAVKAFNLYTKAADKGHAQALYNLANMYYSGTGTTKDYKVAYKLFLKSKIKGVEESKYYIEKISDDITPEELNFLNEEFESLIEKKIDLPVPVVVEE